MSFYAYHFTLSDQLACVELCHNAFKDFVDDGRQYSLIVIESEFSEDYWEGINIWSGQNTACDIDHLEIWHGSSMAH